MKGDDLLLRHLAALPSPEGEPEEERPPALERLEAALGRDLARGLLGALAPPRA